MKRPIKETWISVAAAAKQLGMTEEVLMAQIQTQGIHYFSKPGHGWCIEKHQLSRLKTAKKVKEWRKPNEY